MLCDLLLSSWSKPTLLVSDYTFSPDNNFIPRAALDTIFVASHFTATDLPN